MSFLEEAVKASRKEARERMEYFPVPLLQRLVRETPGPRDFKAAVKRRDVRNHRGPSVDKPGGGPKEVSHTRLPGASAGIGIIAEVKRSSPSAGAIRDDLSLDQLVSTYQRGGACAVSVLTCKYKFNGSIRDLIEVVSRSGVPVLRKDFIVEDYQVLESRAYGASAILLIAAALEESRMEGLMDYARNLGMESLVEVHGREDLEKTLSVGAPVIGINNRDLATLEVDLETTEGLMELIPDDRVVVSESGIKNRKQVERMEGLGVDALLVGETLMRSGDPKKRLKVLMGEVSEPCGSKSVE